MNKKSICLLFLAITLTAVLVASINVHKVAAPYPTIYIKADGSIDPSTANITSADNVTYTFTADINAHIVVEKNNTVVDGAGYTVQGPGSGIGINMTWRSNVTLENVEVTNFNQGIFLRHSSNNTITGNTASNSSVGITLPSSNLNIVTGNTVSNNIVGVHLFNSNNNTVTGNTVSSNSKWGISLDFSSNNTITGNTASNGNYYGIQLSGFSNNNTITGNTASNNEYLGIALGICDSNIVTGNTASNNTFGIAVSSSNSNIVTGNTVSSNSKWGITLEVSSNNNTVIGNTASNNEVGINVYSSSNNTITGNTASNNEYGLRVSYSPSSDNVLFHNNFIDNTKQVEVVLSDVGAWDDGVEGNYWSNYTGVDLDHDGIGDIEHVIDASNTDYYPLMGPFHGFNTSLGKSVNVISNSTVDSFQYESPSTIHFQVSNTTANQTHGFCRVSIPYEVLSAPFNVTIDGVNPTYWNYTLYDNGTHRWIYFEYEHSTKEVVIIPEFPSFLILPLFMAATLLAALANRRKHSSL